MEVTLSLCTLPDNWKHSLSVHFWKHSLSAADKLWVQSQDNTVEALWRVTDGA